MDDAGLLEVLRLAADAVAFALEELEDWGLAETLPGQHHSDLLADRVAIEVLEGAGLSVLSEESGLHARAGSLLAVLDPLDGSTNAAQGIPWYATSICVLDEEGPLVALVRNQALDTSYEASRGSGAYRDGERIATSGCAVLEDAVVGLAGYPPAHLGWRQYRALGAAALDLCLVAEGTLDAYLDASQSAHGPWDYLGGLLVCAEAGATLDERDGLDLVVRTHGPRRSPLVGATAALTAELAAAHRAAVARAR
jgi:myo-inositol-1(or 4)-monophosphatase